MTPKQEWGAFSVIIVLAVLLIAAGLVQYGYDPLPAAAFAFVAIVIFAYIVYKRYHVEVVPESDVSLFEDPDDLRILCEIYGLDTSGDEDALRARLSRFARENRDHAFVWIAPRVVSSLASPFGMSEPKQVAVEDKPEKELLKKILAEPESGSFEKKRLIGGINRSVKRLSSIAECPICSSPAPKEGMVCPECGADLEFYLVLSESKVGKMLVSEKAHAARRKD